MQLACGRMGWTVPKDPDGVAGCKRPGSHRGLRLSGRISLRLLPVVVCCGLPITHWPASACATNTTKRLKRLLCERITKVHGVIHPLSRHVTRFLRRTKQLHGDVEQGTDLPA